MNVLEFKKVLTIIKKADGGCAYCVTDLLKELKKAFPEHSVEIDTEMKITQDGAYKF